MKLTQQDNNRTIELSLGAVITVRLQENPTTGYRWAIESAGGLEVIGDEFEAGAGAIGAAGERVFQFRAASPGSHELHIKNGREWESDQSVTERFDMKAVVK